MDVRVELDGDQAVVYLAGDLDMSSTVESMSAIEPVVLGKGLRGLTVELTQVQFMDSTGLNMLIRTARLCEDHQVDLHIRGAGTRVRRVLDLTGMANFFDLS